jgi:hypothetical protein
MIASSGRRVLALGVAVLLFGIACTRTGPPGPGGPTTTTTAGHDHGGGHGHTPDRLDHEPTADQKAAAVDLIRRTRAAVKEQGITLAKLQERGYINNGDGIHWILPEYARDGIEIDPYRVESFVVRSGRVQAAMFSLNLGETMDDVPDIAGNWIVWHSHRLRYQSADPADDRYFKLAILGPGTYRDTSPMFHIWLEKHPCGPFAGTEREEGSCLPEIDPDFPV